MTYEMLLKHDGVECCNEWVAKADQLPMRFAAMRNLANFLQQTGKCERAEIVIDPMPREEERTTW